MLDRGDDGLLARWESLLLETTLRRHRYNQVHSADRLGISRHALRTLLKRYDLLPETRAPRV
ncbi:helix-turn-helix domain-containing protein [Azotobacter vinelandii]